MKKKRLEWCLKHKNWTLEDWKNVIWSDETSVILLHRRGGYRIWRRADEAFSIEGIEQMNKKLETGTKILIPKLLPFAKACAIKQPNTIVQEDKALSHNHHVQQLVYDKAEVQRLLWCGNSPDLNPIEPCWPWMKRYTTKKGAPKNRKDAIKAWEDCWNMLLQKQIQSRIERVPVHIQKIIELGGGNEYREGCTQQDWRQKNPQQAEQQDDELEWVEILSTYNFIKTSVDQR
ncbi:hypothetical protein BDFG_01252 [Blastomyces dermatitidis ATCC 26199]|nr:hypothetical protein BDFG_01252 [Blastomyces dermatitidis ATCC 26199]